MCTLLIARMVWPGYPLVVAANRDELLDRPAAPPQLSHLGSTRILAPVDLVAGGTWLGINERGLFVGITNRFGHPKDPLLTSRGHLVTEALAAPSAEAAASAIASRDPKACNGFHLVVADAHAGYVIVHEGDRLSLRPLEAGSIVVTERSFGAAPTRREGLLEERIDALGRDNVPEVETLADLLSLHDPDGFEGVCVHVPTLGYGTRSSTILRLADTPGASELWHAPGPPCTTEYVREDEALRDLLSSPGRPGTARDSASSGNRRSPA